MQQAKTSATTDPAAYDGRGWCPHMDAQLIRILDSIVIPGAERSVVQLGLVRQVQRHDGQIPIELGDAALMEDVRQSIGEHVRAAITDATGEAVSVQFVNMTPEEENDIRHAVAVMSGKGDVGKSLVTGLLAVALERAGYRVGILDADLTGPSIPRMFDIDGRPTGSSSGVLPTAPATGKPVMKTTYA